MSFLIASHLQALGSSLLRQVNHLGTHISNVFATIELLHLVSILPLTLKAGFYVTMSTGEINII